MAEGAKQAAILNAEAAKETAIKKAEGQAQAILEVQRAKAESIKLLNEASPTNAVIALKGMETFERVSDGQSTKIIIPSNLQNLAGLVTSFAEINEKYDPKTEA